MSAFLRKNIYDPEKKREIIGQEFLRAKEKASLQLKLDPKKWLLGQGTIYPDRIESAQPTKHADKIKSHHNLTFPKGLQLKILEPLSEFYKDEVRKIGAILKIGRAHV